VSSAIFSLGVRWPLQSLAASSPPARPFSGPAPLARDRVVPEPCGFRLSWGSCSHERHYVGCPVSPTRPKSRFGGRRVATPPVGAVLRVLAPLDGSGYARGTHGPLRIHRSPWRPDASRPCSMPLASLELPSRAFPSRGAVPALAGLVLPCGFRSPTAAGAEPPGDSRSLSLSCRLFAREPRRSGARTHEPGRQFPAVARRSPRRAAERASEDRHFPSTLGSPVNGRHARFEALLPSGVRSLDDPMPWPGRDRRVGALLGFFLSRASSTTVQGAVFRADARSRDEPWTSHVVENPAASLRSRDPSSDARGHDPGIRRHAEVDRTRVPPSGSDPAHPRFANAVAPVASPTRRFRDNMERFARAPSRRRPVPPASFTSRTPEGREPLDPEDTSFEPSTRPTPCEASGRPTPLEVDLAPRCRVGHGLPVVRATALDPSLASRACGGPPCCQVGHLL